MRVGAANLREAIMNASSSWRLDWEGPVVSFATWHFSSPVVWYHGKIFLDASPGC